MDVSYQTRYFLYFDYSKKRYFDPTSLYKAITKLINHYTISKKPLFHIQLVKEDF
jgi:hypothetical protein